MKISRIDAAAHRFIARRILELLQPLEAELGIKITGNGGQLQRGTAALFRFNAAVIDATGAAQTPERKLFATLATNYGLQPDDLDRQFIWRGVVYKLVGLSPSRPKYPFDVMRVDDDRSFKFGREIVRILPPRAKAA